MCQCAPGLVIEQRRLERIDGTFLGCVGDPATHTYGFHLCNPPAGDYSRAGNQNVPVGDFACAIDVGMDWAASRQWLQWLITEIRDDRITGIAEVIGSFDGQNVRYWSDNSGWDQQGVKYDGDGHDHWTHVAIYRSTARQDHRILAGWTATGYTGGTMADDYGNYGKPGPVADRTVPVMIADLWNQERSGVSPYDGKTATARTAQLARIEAGVKTIISSGTGTITLTTEQLNTIANILARPLSELLAPRLVDELARRLES